MGACLCRDNDQDPSGPDVNFTDPGQGHHDLTSLASESSLCLMMAAEAGAKCSKDTVNSLVLDTLHEIRTLVENEQARVNIFLQEDILALCRSRRPAC